MGLTPGVEAGDREAAVRAQFDGQIRPGAAQAAHHPPQDQHGEPTRMTAPGAEDRRDQVAGVAIKDEQGMVHVLAIVAMVADAFLLPVRRVIGPIEVQDDALGRPRPFALADVEFEQGRRQRFDRVAIDRVLQAREGRLAGQRGAGRRPAATDQLEQGIGTQGGGIVLIGVATGDLVDALAQERRERVPDPPAAPLRNAVGQGVAQVQGRIGLGQPGQPAITGQPPGIERRLQRDSHGAVKVDRRGGRMNHRSTFRIRVLAATIVRTVLRFVYPIGR
jgi:hypothetical protein